LTENRLQNTWHLDRAELSSTQHPCPLSTDFLTFFRMTGKLAVLPKEM